MKYNSAAWEITEITDPLNLALIRELFLEYAGSLDFDLDFQNFDSEMAELWQMYGPPGGGLFLASGMGKTLGCVAFRQLEPMVCEMKRLYVRPHAQGLGLGRALCKRVMERAASAGYALMRLDTVESMARANALYLSLGFYDIAPYCVNPLPGARFLEARLQL